jgi:superfamily II DNA or RNA helicase
MKNEEIANFFNTMRPFIQGNPDLRDPQVEGWFRTRQHFRNSSEHAILQISVGCGKTGLMALLPFGIAQGRVLVIAPNLEIRRGISTAFDVAGRECFWTSTRVLTDVNHGPFTAVLDGQDANIHDCENSHIVVTNIQQLASRADRWLPAFRPHRVVQTVLRQPPASRSGFRIRCLGQPIRSENAMPSERLGTQSDRLRCCFGKSDVSSF